MKRIKIVLPKQELHCMIPFSLFFFLSIKSKYIIKHKKTKKPKEEGSKSYTGSIQRGNQKANKTDTGTNHDPEVCQPKEKPLGLVQNNHNERFKKPMEKNK